MNIKNLIDEYYNWLKSETTFEKFGKYYEITLPFLDDSNDYIQIYVKNENYKFYLTDDGFTLANIEMRGINLTQQRKKIINDIVLQYGLKLDGICIIGESDEKSFIFKKHLFIQVILKITDLFSGYSPKQHSIFDKQVQNFLDEKGIDYMQNITINGISGFSHNLDFCFQKKKKEKIPERLCKIINNPSKEKVTNILFIFSDITKIRKESKNIVILNDDKEVSSNIKDAFKKYDIYPLEWSKKEKIIKLLA